MVRLAGGGAYCVAIHTDYYYYYYIYLFAIDQRILKDIIKLIYNAFVAVSSTIKTLCCLILLTA